MRDLRGYVQNRHIEILKEDPLGREGLVVTRLVPMADFERVFAIARRYIGLFEQRIGLDVHWDIQLLFGSGFGIPVEEVQLIVFHKVPDARANSGLVEAAKLLTDEHIDFHRRLLLASITVATCRRQG